LALLLVLAEPDDGFESAELKLWIYGSFVWNLMRFCTFFDDITRDSA